MAIIRTGLSEAGYSMIQSNHHRHQSVFISVHPWLKNTASTISR